MVQKHVQMNFLFFWMQATEEATSQKWKLQSSTQSSSEPIELKSFIPSDLQSILELLVCIGTHHTGVVLLSSEERRYRSLLSEISVSVLLEDQGTNCLQG